MKFVCKLFPLVLLITAFALTACGGGGGGGGGGSASDNTTSPSSPVTNTNTTSISNTTQTVKTPTDPKAVGDIVFNDGSAIPYSSTLILTDAQKNAAVAYIFYKGTECSDNGLNRTLGVGIKLTDEMNSWCRYNSYTNYAAAFYVNITTVQDTKKNGSDSLSKIGEFLGTNNDTGTEENYPIFYYAKNYGIRAGTSLSGWYLPSKVELQKIYEQRTALNAVCTLCNVDTYCLTHEVWWSSSQYALNPSNGYSLAFSDGSWQISGKEDYENVFAIREF